MLVFLYFLYFIDLFFKTDSNQLEQLLIAHILKVNKKGTSLEQARTFLVKNNLAIFTPESKFQAIVFIFFSYFADLVLKFCSCQLEKK